MKYSADTSMLIQTWRLYPQNIFPSVWRMMDDLVNNSIIVATEEVRHELAKKDDDVLSWARQRRSLFVPVNDAVQLAVRNILRRYPRLIDTRRNRSGADPFVVGLAMAANLTVVTEERPTNSANRPSIPDACAGLGVRCINILDMLREEGGQF